MGKNLTLFYLARQNLRRKLFRSMVTIFAIALVTSTLFPTSIIGRSVSSSLNQGAARLGADMMVVPPGYTANLASSLISGEPSTFLMDGSVTPAVRQIRGVARVAPQLYFATLASG